MIMKKLLFVFFTLILLMGLFMPAATPVMAVIRTLEGHVYDYCTSAPIEGALIIAGSQSTATDSSGFYQLTLETGTYDISATKSGYKSVTSDNVLIVAGAITTQNFDLQPLLCISGQKLDDCTGAGLAGWTIELYDGEVPIATTMTDADGYYQFCGLEAGDYTVKEITQAGWYAVSPTSRDVTLICNNVTSQNFTNHELMYISGQKLDDCTGAGLAGWTIELYDGEVCIATTTTDADGYYQFFGLEAGDYTVKEIVQAGWYAVSPTSRDVILICNNVTSQNFTNAGPEPPTIEVGGNIYPLNKIILLVPLSVLGIILMAGTILVIRRRSVKN
jgi:hypothetical protein